jgi:hypothetical protein
MHPEWLCNAKCGNIRVNWLKRFLRAEFNSPTLSFGWDHGTWKAAAPWTTTAPYLDLHFTDTPSNSQKRRLMAGHWTYNYRSNYRRHADLIDSKLIEELPYSTNVTNYWAVSHPPDFYSLFDHARFKFVLSLDGNTCSNRFAKLLHLNSVVLKEDSEWMEYFYGLLHPGEHYLPIFNRSLFDLFDV